VQAEALLPQVGIVILMHPLLLWEVGVKGQPVEFMLVAEAVMEEMAELFSQ
jgi:hypothetical protein